jgi:hypothetical protein
MRGGILVRIEFAIDEKYLLKGKCKKCKVIYLQIAYSNKRGYVQPTKINNQAKTISLSQLMKQ